MRKNNKGFTMIEILAAIIIMGILLMLVVPAVSRLMKGFREDYYTELEETIEASAREFYTDNKIYRPDGILKASFTSIESLISKEYVDKLVDYKGKTCSLDPKESYVIVIYRGKDDYQYKTCIKCSNDDYQTSKDGTYCDEAWRTNDNIKYNFGDDDEIYIYHNTTKEEVRKKLLNNINVVKYNKKGEAIDRVVLAEGNVDNVLPKNIDELDTTIIDSNTNMKETILEYEIEDETKELSVIVYKHQEPKVEIENAKGESYTSGTWTNKVIITLSKNDDFFEKSSTSVGSFQWSINDGVWKNIECDMKSNDTCSVAITENVNANYKFRIVTNEGKISDETSNYLIRVDVDKPTVTINPNGSEPIINVGSTTNAIYFTLTTNDTGGSEIKSRKFRVNTDNTTTPALNTFVSFNSDVYNYANVFSGNKYYVWVQVEDNAGNISTGVWPSNVFHMKYEIIFAPNGGLGGPGTLYKKHGNNLTISSSEPVRTGYKFKGWSTSSTGDVVYKPGDLYTNDAAIRLYAVWEANDYTVTYNANGGSVTPSSKSVTYNSTYGTLPTPTRTGYTFTGWYTSATGGSRVYSTTTVTTASNHTIYAQWTPNVLTVNYYSNYATESFSGALNTVSGTKNVLVRTTTHLYDTEYSDGLWNYSPSGASTYLARTGYTATGNWGTSTSGGTLVNQNTAFDSGQALALALGEDLSSGSVTVDVYPQWTENVLTVNYYSNYATESFSGALNTVGADKNVLVRTTTIVYSTEYPYGLHNYSSSGSGTYLARTGYTATGKWGTTTSGGTLVDEDTSFTNGQAFAQALGKDLSSSSQTINIYAQWTINKYTVTYNANGGSVSPTSATANYGSSVTLPTPTRSGGYTFNGWYTSASGGTRKGGGGSSYKVEANITLYAQWTAPSIPEHTCKGGARARYTVSLDNEEYILKWYGVNEHNHWCTNSNKTESCIPTQYSGTSTKIPMYQETCDICGNEVGTVWCPVHASGGSATSGLGGKNIEICDAETKTYSSDATNCAGKNLGWTQVSK